MSKNIVRFPQRHLAQLRKDRRQHRIRCEMSPRWIQFADRINRYTDQDYLHLDVMTLDANEKDRRLCELVLDPQELLKVLAAIPITDSREE